MENPLQETPQSETPSRQNQFIVWLKRLGVVGFLFFLFKGLMWLLVPVLIAKGC